MSLWERAVFVNDGSVVREARGRLDAHAFAGQPSTRAGIAQLVEHNLAKVGVAGSSPVSRSGVFLVGVVGRLAQLVRAPR